MVRYHNVHQSCPKDVLPVLEIFVGSGEICMEASFELTSTSAVKSPISTTIRIILQISRPLIYG